VSVDQDSGQIAYSRNVEGYNELTVGEIAGPTTIDRSPEPDLPGGIAGGVSWGPEGDRFAVTVTGRTVNTNVFVVETATGEAERWTYASTAGIPESTFVAPEVVRFESFDGREIPAFFSLPDGAVTDGNGANAETASGETPVIVDIHGGPESQRRPSFSGLTQYYLSRGYAVFEPNVRGSTGYGTEYTRLDDVEKRMDSVRDIEAGVEWFRDHPAVDTDRIVAMGGSYGGFMVLAAMTEYPDLWAAGVDVVGIANFVTFLENTGDWRRSLRRPSTGRSTTTASSSNPSRRFTARTASTRRCSSSTARTTRASPWTRPNRSSRTSASGAAPREVEGRRTSERGAERPVSRASPSRS